MQRLTQSHLSIGFLTRLPLFISEQERELTVPDSSACSSLLVSPENLSAFLIKLSHLQHKNFRFFGKNPPFIRHTILALSREISNQRTVRQLRIRQSQAISFCKKGPNSGSVPLLAAASGQAADAILAAALQVVAQASQRLPGCLPRSQAYLGFESQHKTFATAT